MINMPMVAMEAPPPRTRSVVREDHNAIFEATALRCRGKRHRAYGCDDNGLGRGDQGLDADLRQQFREQGLAEDHRRLRGGQSGHDDPYREAAASTSTNRRCASPPGRTRVPTSTSCGQASASAANSSRRGSACRSTNTTSSTAGVTASCPRRPRSPTYIRAASTAFPSPSRVRPSTTTRSSSSRPGSRQSRRPMRNSSPRPTNSRPQESRPSPSAARSTGT